MNTSSQSKFKFILSQFLNRNFIIMVLGACIAQFARQVYRMGEKLYSGEILGLSGTELGFVATAAFIASIVAAPVSGWFVDKMKPKVVLVLSTVLVAAAVALMGLANTFIFWTIFRMAQSFTSTTNGNAQNTLSSFCSDKRLIGSNQALYSFLPSLVSAVAVLVANAIFDAAPLMVFYSAAIIYLIASVPYMFINLKDPNMVARQEAVAAARERKKAEKAAKKSKGFDINDFLYLPALPIQMLSFFNNMVLFSVEIIAVAHGAALGLEIIVYFTAGTAFFRAVGVLIGGFLADLFKRAKYTVLPCMLLTVVSVVILAFSTSPALLTLSGALYGLSKNALGPGLRRASAAITPDEHRGAMITMNTMLVSFAGTVGSLFAGIMYDSLGGTMAILATGIYPVLGILIYFINAKKIAAAEDSMGDAPQRAREH